MGDLTGKVAVVTGAASAKSMGRYIAVQLSKDGANVVAVDKYAVPKTIHKEDSDWNGLYDVVREVEKEGVHGLAIEADVSNGEDVDRIVSETIKQFGKIDILVNCVGVRGPVGIPITELDEETWNMLLRINLTGAFLLSKKIGSEMIKGDTQGRSIIHISSVAGIRSYPYGAGYNASKHGVCGLVKCLAIEMAKYGITVNAICPGAVDTNFRDATIQSQAAKEGRDVQDLLSHQAPPPFDFPLRRIGKPQDIANLVSFLVSPKASYITGEILSVRGGVGI